MINIDSRLKRREMVLITEEVIKIRVKQREMLKYE